MQLYHKLRAGDSKEIRLVHLEDIDKETNEVICRLETVEFNKDLQYRALSYYWGDPTNSPSIICDGSRLKATPNLDSALRCLLRKGKSSNLPLSFWVDAICINQEDNDEKEVQVRLMGDIYRQASEVIVWLGAAADNSDLAFQVCERLCSRELELEKTQKKEGWGRKFVLYDHVFFAEGSRMFNPNGVHKFARELDSIQAILARPWWSRIWIIQEVALAKQVVVFCGDSVINWITLDIGITACMKIKWSDQFVQLATLYHAHVLFEARRMAMHDPELKGKGKTQYHLCHLLGQFRWSMATNPRDKVYGLLGMTTEHLSHVSYNDNTEDCYRAAIIDVIKSTGSLDILQLCRKPPGLETAYNADTPKLPSWLPDLRLDVRNVDPAIELSGIRPIGLQSFPAIEQVMLEIPRLRNIVFRASNGSVENDPCLQGADILVLKGQIFDKIMTLGEMQTGAEAQRNERTNETWNYVREVRARTHTPAKFFKAVTTSLSGWSQDVHQIGAEKLLLTRWRQLASSRGTEYPTGESLNQAFFSTLLQGNLGNDPEQRIAQYEAEWNRVLGSVDAINQSFLLKNAAKESKVRQSIATMVHFTSTFLKDEQIQLEGDAIYTHFTLTELGYFALMPPGAREGDSIVLFRGGPVPFLIRQRVHDKDDPLWELIGPCYVHGIMQGEQWKEEACESIKLV
ncbi:heterokaryon incompatibility protein-domain-containing protein [Truncatella angustata]|uniref:Heterokaryon incompatibility protein-domain-containing protein n=1 Tax=Truncatella angustata TaxID=152316 RepID=A0A9P8UED8_9PEZI|nr:heterokaryon incompatibility protein-domain-containing protein [Truncatella angustata]KAH6648387.1 heterokaryon incompatibility protein-domain-containing protein [Truncatella angustata]KAH8204825.1 hypothetical protein TruAng_001014 [Truncatella angustata]